MTVLSDYVSGTITLTNGSIDFTGTGTGWLLAGFKEGDTIIDITGATEFMGVIASIDTNAGGKLTKPWEGPTLVDAPYRMRYQPDGSRVSAQARNLIELLGDGTLVSLAGLTGPGVIELLAGGGAQVVPKSDLVNGVAYDVQVDTLADRDAYDGQSDGFAVLVSDVGDGRSALYSKNSNAVGDWSDPAYITGPVGPLPDVEATVTSLPPGSTAVVTEVPITGGVRLDFELPEASGFYNAGVYNIANPYNQDDVVRFNGSSFIALQAVPVGESPSSAFPPVDTAYWQVLAAKGQDGTGTGDVVGPASSLNGGFARFSGTSGKLLIGTGVQISDADIVDSPTSTIKGRIAAGNGPATNLTPAQVLALLNAYARTNILGIVSQSGGVPTGAIIENGSNASGSYVRFADGTQICYTAQLIFLDTNLFQGVTLPAAFAANSFPKTNISFAVSASSGTDAAWRQGVKSLMPYTTSNGANYLVDSGSFSASGIVYGLHIGRWF